MYEAFHKTPLGFVRVRADEEGITSISIRDEACLETPSNSPLIKLALQQLDEYFEGIRTDFDLPLNQAGTEFQQQVWQQLITIPYGKTITYGQQSHLMNSPLAIRAIASANGKNNLWIVVPCHRVIGSNGSLTGYAGGIWRKQWLLDHEARVMGIGQTKLFF
jgi:methylated-DNA-[protein]-cysteine S-methyltransferase